MSGPSAGVVARKLGSHETVLRHFTIYAGIPKLHLVPAYRDHGLGGEAIAVFVEADDERPAYRMQVEWRGSQIVRTRNFRHARYILEGADPAFSDKTGGRRHGGA
jgi:RNA polymerase sigma-70 factor (ECF subfamily)